MVPSFIYEYVDRSVFPVAWNEPTKSHVRGEHKVKDVCKNCNHTLLSSLDSYGKAFLLDNNLVEPLYAPTISVAYDYSLLSRWLMKIFFNAMRASRRDHPVSAHGTYVLTGQAPPSRKRFFMLAELLKPHRHIGERPAFANAEGLSNPFFVRITSAVVADDLKGQVEIGSIGFGGLFFHLVFVNKELSPPAASRVKKRIVKTMPRSELVEATESSVLLRPSDKDWVEARSAQAAREIWLRTYGEEPPM